MDGTERDPRFNKDNLIWIDMEMTGLQPEIHRVIEVAAIITDADLNILRECPPLAIHQSDEILAGMDQWNRDTHGRSGLIGRVRDSDIDEERASDLLLAEFARFLPPGRSPMCGNTIGQDRRFMARWMPRLEAFFHYRSVDVSTLKELARLWRPELLAGHAKSSRHEALSDTRDSIEELRYYRRCFLRES